MCRHIHVVVSAPCTRLLPDLIRITAAPGARDGCGPNRGANDAKVRVWCIPFVASATKFMFPFENDTLRKRLCPPRPSRTVEAAERAGGGAAEAVQ
eukprot:gene12639-biopygen22995